MVITSSLFSISYLSLTAGPPDPPGGVETVVESSPVTVSWRAVADANRYTVTFSQVQGTSQQGLCPSGSHTARTTVEGVTTASIPVGEDVESADMLRAYTTYDVTVVAVSDARGTSSPSDTETVTTPQTSKSDLGISVCQTLYVLQEQERLRGM